MSLNLYKDLTPITDFTQITGPMGFMDVPSSWSVILTDLRGSTKAIEEGRYKEVNLIGAAGIAVIKNMLGTREFPFVFGGDGATCVLPADETERVKRSLQLLQGHATKMFSMSLRVGVVPVADVLAEGGRIQVGKFQMGQGACIGLFRGGGLQIAEDLIKGDLNNRYVLPPVVTDVAPPLHDLSCRWAPIVNRNGTIVSVMIQARVAGEASEVFRQILEEIHPIFDSKEFNPVHFGGMHLESFWKNLKREIALRQDLGYWEKFKQVLMPSLMVQLMKRMPFGSAKKIMIGYLEENIRVSDYKKLDDTLRMVLDCSLLQSQELEELLRKHLLKGEIYYGMTRSDSALMTCIVEGMNQGEHIHFIDGADGGYALASKQLKLQRSRQKTS